MKETKVQKQSDRYSGCGLWQSGMENVLFLTCLNFETELFQTADYFFQAFMFQTANSEKTLTYP
jgi:hypothetical protein